MEKVIDAQGEFIGWAWRCAWCAACGRTNADYDLAFFDLIAHQLTKECIAATK